MEAYNNLMDKIGAAIIDWSDPDGSFRADREVSDFKLRSMRVHTFLLLEQRIPHR